MIEDKMFAIQASSVRLGYWKISGILSGVLLAIVGFALLLCKINQDNVITQVTQEIYRQRDRNKLAKITHLLFYQYYQYYQIVTYPQQILDIQPYNMTSLKQSYFQSVNNNIRELNTQILNPDIYTYIQTNKTVQYSNFNSNESSSTMNIYKFL